MNYNSYFGNLFAAFSQFLHALAGGHNDISMSAMCYKGEYIFLRNIIDWTFQPIEPYEHCYNAYMRDKGERYNDKPYTIPFYTFVLLGVFVLNIIFMFYRLFKLIKRIIKK